MNTITALIVDDEPAAVAVVKTLLEQLEPDISIAGVAQDGLEAMQMITRLKPQIVFLDVNMPVIDGVQVMEKLAGQNCQVIFTTGTSEFAFKALKLKAADYLLKPIDPAEFVVAVSRAREQLHRTMPANESREKEPVKLQLPTMNEILFVAETEISHITGMGSYCQVNMINGEKVTISKNLGQMEAKLSLHLFFRSHNSHIINLDFVSKYTHKEGYFVEMKSGVVLEVSRRSKDALLEALTRHTR